MGELNLDELWIWSQLAGRCEGREKKSQKVLEIKREVGAGLAKGHESEQDSQIEQKWWTTPLHAHVCAHARTHTHTKHKSTVF